MTNCSASPPSSAAGDEVTDEPEPDLYDRQPRPVTGGRRVGTPGRPSASFRTLRAIVTDPRFPMLTAGAQSALQVAITTWADSRGRWWPKKQTWAAALGITSRTIQRHIAELEASGLITVEEWRRPPGSAGGPQGGNTYRLDPDLLQGETETSTPVRGDTNVSAARGDRNVHPTRGDTDVSPGTGLNGSKNGLTSPISFIDDCMKCGAHGPVTDDGTHNLCTKCRLGVTTA